jgi:hypothetical protein
MDKTFKTPLSTYKDDYRHPKHMKSAKSLREQKKISEELYASWNKGKECPLKYPIKLLGCPQKKKTNEIKTIQVKRPDNINKISIAPRIPEIYISDSFIAPNKKSQDKTQASFDSNIFLISASSVHINVFIKDQKKDWKVKPNLELKFKPTPDEIRTKLQLKKMNDEYWKPEKKNNSKVAKLFDPPWGLKTHQPRNFTESGVKCCQKLSNKK